MSRAALVSLKGNKEVGGGGINGAGRRWEREGFAPGLSWEDGGGKARRLFGGSLGGGVGWGGYNRSVEHVGEFSAAKGHWRTQ